MIGGNFWRKNKKPVSMIILFLLPLIPLYYDEIPFPKLHLYEKFNHYISEPLSSLSSLSRHGIQHLWNRYISLIDVEKENEHLMKKLAESRKKIVELEENENENERLQKLLHLQEKLPYKTLTARIIGYDPLKERLSFFINVGSSDGIEDNMPVVVSEGVVGTIAKVYPNSSLVTSILNPNHSVDGRVKRTRSRLIVEGLGESLLAELKYLDRAEDIRVGDTVLTSGLDPVFPKGLVIGTIVELKRPRIGVTQMANLRASADIGKLEEISVILKTPMRLEELK